MDRPGGKEGEWSCAAARTGSAARAAPAKTPSAEAGEVISRIVPLGRPLSTQIQELAARLGVPVDDLLFAARKKAVARVRAQLAGARKPDPAQVIKGGESIRIAFKLTPQELARLQGWFDPLELGLATKPLAALLAAALRADSDFMAKVEEIKELYRGESHGSVHKAQLRAK